MHEEGRLVAGRYRLQDPVGEGGMGVVWRAVDERLGRQVAVKQLRTPVAAGARQAEQARQRVLREARIAARLHHPNAVGVHDVTEDAGSPVLVMEYLPARSLAELLTERGALPVPEVARIGAAAAAALAAAHEVGIVHRDIKPANILLGHDGTTKITDFGISHAAGDVTVTSTGLLGTPAFLAPEVARGEPPGPAADVFSLGATLYAAVEGTPPFGLTENPIAQLHRTAAGNAPPARRAGPLAGLLEQMLRDDPAGRPSMAHVATVLAATTASGPALTHASTMALPPVRPAGVRADTRIDARPVRPGPGSGRPRRHRGLLIAALVGCALLGLLLSVLLTAPHGGPAAGPPGSPSTAAPSRSATAARAVADPALLEQAVSDYYALLPDHPDQAWTRLGPDRQRQGRAEYEQFWHDVKDLQVVGPAQAHGNAVTVTISYRTSGHDRVQEAHRLGMIVRNGTVLIDTDQLTSQTSSSNTHGHGKGDSNGNGGDNGGG